jgi:hypothetical protein
MKIKIEIELDTVRDEQELKDLIDIIENLRNKNDDDDYDYDE